MQRKDRGWNRCPSHGFGYLSEENPHICKEAAPVTRRPHQLQSAASLPGFVGPNSLRLNQRREQLIQVLGGPGHSSSH